MSLPSLSITTRGKSSVRLIGTIWEMLIKKLIPLSPSIAVSCVAELHIHDVDGFIGGNYEKVHRIWTDKSCLLNFKFVRYFKKVFFAF